MTSGLPTPAPASRRLHRLRQRLARQLRHLIAALLPSAQESLILPPYALRLRLIPQPARRSTRHR